MSQSLQDKDTKKAGARKPAPKTAAAKDAPLKFRAALCSRQSALMLSGGGERLLIELEAFGLDAILAMVGLAKLTGKPFVVTVEEIREPAAAPTLTELNDATREGSESQVITVGRRRSQD